MAATGGGGSVSGFGGGVGVGTSLLSLSGSPGRGGGSTWRSAVAFASGAEGSGSEVLGGGVGERGVATTVTVPASIVAYDAPVLVGMARAEACDAGEESEGEEEVGVGDGGEGKVGGEEGRLGWDDEGVSGVALVRSLVPAREWRDREGRVWRQKPLTTMPSREDAVRAGKMLDLALERVGARKEPVCKERERCVAEAWDEVVRQVLLLEPSRGLLLLRVQNERRLTVMAHAARAQAAVRYVQTAATPTDPALALVHPAAAQTKPVEERQEADFLAARCAALVQQVQRLRDTRLRLVAEIGAWQRNAAERKRAEQERHQQEIQRLQRQVKVLKRVLQEPSA